MTAKQSPKGKTRHLDIILTATVLVALIVFAAYLLVGLYPDVLITAQDRNPFSGDSLYFSQQIAHPFGFLQYIGGFLTQFFFHPALGASMLIVIWAASVFAGIKAFRLKGLWRSLMIIPVACLLASQLDLGYWVYCLPIHGYWFSQSVALLFLLLLLWAAHSTPRRFRILWYVFICFVCFPLFGWISYLFAVCFAFSQFAKGETKSTATWVDGVGVAIASASPFVFRALLYKTLSIDEVCTAGFPFFINATDSSLRPTLPFFYIIGTTVFLSLGRVLPPMKKIPSSLAFAVVGIASSVAVWSAIFKDENYHYEIKMTQASMVDDWQSVIRVAEKAKAPSRTMVMLKNIALLNTSQLGDRSFELSNDGNEINNPDSLNINIMHIASQIIYYNHGVPNYSNRWCIEFAVPYGFSPYYLKMLVRCAQSSGEKALAQRYIRRLHTLMFYRDWQPAPDSRVVKSLKSVFSDALDNDENSVERYLISRFDKEHHPNSQYYCELNLLYSMIIRDPNNFWQSLYNYLITHKSPKLPTQIEEAYCVFNDQAPVNFPIKVNISPATSQRYKEFWDAGNGYAERGFTEDEVRELMRDEWGGTYWWFNAFGRMNY